MARKLVVEIVGDTSSLDRAFDRTRKNAEGFGVAVRRGALIAGAALGGGLVLAARAGFSELAEGQEVAAQTAAALKSTGGVANVTADQVADLAQEQSNLTGIDDELIQSSENLLLTFKNVHNEVGKGNDIFNRATKSSLDLSKAGFGSVESASKMLGKALNDPIKGMTALGRAGVTFSDDQKKAIKALVETGHSLDAQKLILKEVESQVGGSAKAWGETLPGQLSKAKNSMMEVAAGITVLLLPALNTLARVVQKVAGFFQEHETTAKVLTGTLLALSGVLLAVGVSTKIYAAAQAIVKAATVAWTAVQWLLNAALTANPIGLVVVAIAALVAGIILAWKHSETFRRIVTAAFDAVKSAANAVLNFFRDNWKIIATLISGPFAPIVALATDAFGIRSKLVAAATAILDFFRNHWKEIAVIISGPFAPLVALATNAFGIRSALINAFGFIVSGVREKVTALITVVAGIPGKVTKALGSLGSLLLDAGKAIIQGLIDGINAMLGPLKTALGFVKKLIPDWKGPIEDDRKLLIPAGRAIIEGLMVGISDRLPDLERLTTSIAPKIDVGRQDASVPDWARGVQAGADASVKAFAETGAAKDELGANFQQFSADSVAANDQVAQSIDRVKLSQLTASGVLKKDLAKTVEAINPLVDETTDTFDRWAEAIKGVRFAVYQLRDGLRDTAADISKLLTGSSGGSIASVIKGRAAGGPVKAGTPYIVGEAGPELFVPSSSGTIVSAASRNSMVGGTTVVNYFYGDVTGDEIVRKVREGLLRIDLYNPGSAIARA